jgi:hypothetical protein
MNRETWLQVITDTHIRSHFAKHGYTIPEAIKYSCAYSTRGLQNRKGQKRFVAGQCIGRVNPATLEVSHEIVIVPTQADSIEVVAILIHELTHATVGLNEGHELPFQNCAYAVGLEGKPTETEASEELKLTIAQWLEDIGEYPHEVLQANQRKQSTRMYKCACRCGYTMRISSKWIKTAMPKCPLGHGKMASEYETESGDE